MRLVFAHDGTSTYDRLFLKRLALEYKTYLVTFVPPNQVPEGVRTIVLRDFGKSLGIRRLNNLRIAVGTFWRILQMYLCLKSIRPHVVIGNWVTTYGLYVSVCGFGPFVLFVYGSDVLIDPHRSFIHRWITSKVISSADLILIDSKVQREAVMSLGGSSHKIVCFPWFDLKDLRDTSSDPTLRDKLGWHNNIVVVSVRMHEPHYALDTLIRAIPKVLARSPNVRFLVFGAGTQTSKLIRLAHELNVSGFVHFAGIVARSRLLRYVGSCDIYVSTSDSDGCSSSLLEAMFLGVPVVVTSIDGNKEWISSGFNGLLFQKNDSDGLARAIICLATDLVESKQIVQRAMKTIRERVSWETSTRELVERMNDVCASR